MLKIGNLGGKTPFFASFVCDKGDITARNIIAWAHYFWLISPSNKKTKDLCTKWISYAFNVNRFNPRTAIPAADVLARIGNFEDAKVILEKSLASQKEIHGDPKTLRNLELKLQDIKNKKL